MLYVSSETDLNNFLSAQFALISISTFVHTGKHNNTNNNDDDDVNNRITNRMKKMKKKKKKD